MKVLIIINVYPSKVQPFSAIYVRNLFKSLSERTDVSIFYIERSFTSLSGSIKKYFKGFIKFIPFLFRKYDILHLHFYYPSFIILAHAYKFFHPGTKLVVTFHMSKRFKGLMQWIFSRLLKKVDYSISVGVDLAEEVESNLSLKIDKVISSGIDDSVFFNERNIEKCYDFIFAGSFYDYKGIPELISAIRLLDSPGVRFCFAGSGPYLSELKQLAEKYSVIIKINQTQVQLRRLYNQSKFLVLPSKSETFGLVTTEAIYCGTPAITSTTGGLKEQVVDGENGFVIHEVTGESIKLILEKALNIPECDYTIMVQKALLSNRQFCLSGVTEQHIEIYQKLLNR